MPNVTRASGRLTRQSRAVFGDVSNNDKGESSTTAAAAKKKTTVARVTDAQPVRRRSSRLLRSGNDNGETHANFQDGAALDFSTNNDNGVPKPAAVTAVAPTRRSGRSTANATTSRNTEKNGAKKQSSSTAQGKREDPSLPTAKDKDPTTKNTRSVTITKRIAEPLPEIEEEPAPARTTRSRGRPASQTSASASNAAKRTAKAVAPGGASGDGTSSKPAVGKRARTIIEPPIFSPRKTARTGKSKRITAPKPCLPAKNTGPGPDFFPGDEFRLFRRNQRDGKPFDAAKYTLTIAPADVANRRNIEEASEYVTDIMQRLYDREVRRRLMMNFFSLVVRHFVSNPFHVSCSTTPGGDSSSTLPN